MKKDFSTIKVVAWHFSGSVMKKFAFSLVEILVALIIISVITAALAPVITKKVKSAGVTITGGGGGGGPNTGEYSCPLGFFLDTENNECDVCNAGNFCDGVNQLPCPAGTFSANRASECTDCADGTYALEGSSECLENTATNCADKSKTENACLSCAGDNTLIDGNCISSVPVYKLVNASGSDITSSATEFSKGTSYWTIKIKSSGTLSFTSIPANLIDVFVVGGGAGGQIDSSSLGCNSGVGGGGSYNILRNVVVSTQATYSITIGSGGGASKCNRAEGGTSSAFGTYTRGGVSTGNHSICPFNEASCSQKYGESGNSSNQKANTGNGGSSGSGGQSGVVIIRGSLNPKNALAETIPQYKFFNSSGSDVTSSETTLNVTDTYWYLKFSSGGNVTFDYLPNELIDVFVVGGGAGGQIDSSSLGCNSGVGGGGNYNILRNVVVATGKTYPIAIGSGGSATKCDRPVGGTSSGFGAFSYGGVSTADHSICPFGDATCDFKYGSPGSNINQNHNTGNGGTTAYNAMSGVVIIRGKRTVGTLSQPLPAYKFLNAGGSDSTTANSTLSLTNDYWYLKFSSSGSVVFDYLPSELIDVFVVGGGAGGQIDSSSLGCSAAAGGGGTYGILRDAHVSKLMTYPVSIGSGGGATKCDRIDGGDSSGFGVYSRGGVVGTSYAICPFADANCEYKYGNVGTAANQNHNTGNGGASGRLAMSGVVIIRGKLNGASGVEDKIPAYRLTNSSGSDITHSDTSLNITNTHWFLKVTKSGTLNFNLIKNTSVDVFVVGGGAGGQIDSSSQGCSAGAGGGGNYNIGTNIAVTAGNNYPITIGGGGSPAKCSKPAGGASSALGISAAGGSGGTSHTVCLFNGADCTVTYGNTGASNNQFRNTGNGGYNKKSGMNGVVIIRGTL